MKAGKDKRTPPPRPERKRPGQPDAKANYAVPVDGRPAWGKADALVTIVEFSDFQCPGCKGMAPVLDALHEAYPDQLKIAFRQFPLGQCCPGIGRNRRSHRCRNWLARRRFQ